MKVAILMPGQARFFKKNDDINNLIHKYNCDVFIHTWERKDNTFIGSYFHNKISPFKIDREDIEQYRIKYNPKKMIIEEELTKEHIDSNLKEFSYERTSNHQTKYSFFCYLYSLNKVINLVDNILEYDFFIICRCDMINIILPDLNKVDKNLIITPPINNNPRFINIPHLTVDTTLCVIPSKFIYKYCDLIKYLDIYYSLGYDFNWEEMFYGHLKETDMLKNSTQYNIGDIFFQLKRDEEGLRLHNLF